MATLEDIGVAAGINILGAIIFLLAFAILRLQPFNDRVYNQKWYLKGLRNDPGHSGSFVGKFVNLDYKSYLRSLNWMPAALKMPELELIEHAGLDSAVYLRIYLLGLKIFVPIAFLAWAILVPVNYTNTNLKSLAEPKSNTTFSNITFSNIDKLSTSNIPPGSPRCETLKSLAEPKSNITFSNIDKLSTSNIPPGSPRCETLKSLAEPKSNITFSNITFGNIDKLSISNIPPGSPRFWTHIVVAYAFTLWTCYVLLKEYATIESMRLQFLATAKRRPDQFTVIVRNVPPDPDKLKSISELVEEFFSVNHPDYYLTHQLVYNANKLAKLVKQKQKMQNWLNYYNLKYSRNKSTKPVMKTGFLGLWGDEVDGIDFHTSKIKRLSTEIAKERERVRSDPESIMPAAFVFFKTRWGAAVCAQTQQTRNPTLWLTEWASEPRDVYWKNLAIPSVSLTMRRLVVGVAFFFLATFFMIPVAFVQSMANIEGIGKKAPFLKPIIEVKFIKSIIAGFLPGIALKIFLIVLPKKLMIMSKFEGFISKSSLERRSASRYYIFNVVTVFLGNIITGSAFEQLSAFLNQSANDIPRTIGTAIPMKADFFITYIMVDGWAGIAAEILMLKSLIKYHFKNFFLVKTEKDREEAMDAGSIGFNKREPRIQLYFLLGLVYATVSPLLLPFIIVFFGLAYVVFRHQIINVYNQDYESAAAFWPDVHGRVIAALVISQLLLLGLMSTLKFAYSTPLLVALIVLTISFHRYCKARYEPAFVRYPLQEAMMKDTLERASEPNLNLEGYLQNAYIHPVFKNDDDGDNKEDHTEKWDDENVIVPTKRQSQRNTPVPSKYSGSSSPSLPELQEHHMQP